MESLMIFMKGKKLSKTDKYQRQADLLKKSAEGFTSEEISSVFNFLRTEKTQMAAFLISLCLPRLEVTNSVISDALLLLSHSHTQVMCRSVLDWLTAGVENFFTPQNIAWLQHRYDVVFMCIQRPACTASACSLLRLLTTKKHVFRFRVNFLLNLSAQNAVQAMSGLLSLISVYRLLRPDLLPSPVTVLASVRQPQLGTALGENINEWISHPNRRADTRRPAKQLRLWEHNREKRYRGSTNLMARLNALPGSRPVSTSERRSKNPAAMTKAVAVTSVQTLEDAVRQAAGGGFLPFHCVLPLLLNRQRRAVLLLAAPPVKHLAKVMLELRAHMSLVLRASGRGSTSTAERRQFASSLLMAQRGVLQVPYDAATIVGQLTHARADRVDDWLPLLPLLAFVCWQPYCELLPMLTEVGGLVLRCDRHVQQLFIETLTEMMVRLLDRELPLLRQRRFPYCMPNLLEQIDSVVDVDTDLGRSVECAKKLCESICNKTDEDSDLLYSTVEFCRQVSAALSRAGIPLIVHLHPELILVALQSLDPLLLNSLLSMFAEYPSFVGGLQRVTNIDADTSYLQRRRSTLARISLSAVRGQQQLLTDARNLLYGVNRQRQPVNLLPHLDQETVEQLKTQLLLLNHPALYCFLSNYLSQIEQQDASCVGFAEYLASLGLTGFLEFHKVR